MPVLYPLKSVTFGQNIVDFFWQKSYPEKRGTDLSVPLYPIKQKVRLLGRLIAHNKQVYIGGRYSSVDSSAHTILQSQAQIRSTPSTL